MERQMDMVERVAKAIYATWAEESGITEAWEDVVRVGHSIVPLATKEARAAIDVICEKIAAVALDRGDVELGEIIIAALKEHEWEKVG